VAGNELGKRGERGGGGGVTEGCPSEKACVFLMWQHGERKVTDMSREKKKKERANSGPRVQEVTIGFYQKGEKEAGTDLAGRGGKKEGGKPRAYRIESRLSFVSSRGGKEKTGDWIYDSLRRGEGACAYESPKRGGLVLCSNPRGGRGRKEDQGLHGVMCAGLWTKQRIPRPLR